MNDVALQYPWWLLALLILPLVSWLRWRRGLPALIVPFAAAWWRPVLVPATRLPAILMGGGLVLLVVALARPQKMEISTEVRQEGYDLMLAIDLSGSMLAEDFEQGGVRLNRLQAIKPVIQAFINTRPNDRIGLGITRRVGTMWAAYVFAILSLVSLPAAIASGNLIIIIGWIAQTFLQLVLLPIIIVGQNIQAQSADRRAIATYEDAGAILAEAIEIQAHLAAQDKQLSELVKRMDKLEKTKP